MQYGIFTVFTGRALNFTVLQDSPEINTNMQIKQEPYRIDGMLSQLQLAGVFDQVTGVVFGSFTDCTANYFPQRNETINEVINKYAAKLTIPCIKDFPYGHDALRAVLPIGDRVTLNADEQSIEISFDER